MPSPFAGLRSLFKGRDPEQPEDLNPDFEVQATADDGEVEADNAAPYIDVDLAGEVFGIEYTTPKGDLSRRWVSVEGFKQSKAGDWAICAYCFTRKRVRIFPLGQIQALFDAQGEPVVLSEIFPLDDAGTPLATALTEASGRAIIHACRDGLRALTALAKIDGRLHNREVDFILKYAEVASQREGLSVSGDDEAALQRYIRNMQPTGDLVAASLDRINDKDLPVQKEFFWYAREVMDADGLQDEAEVKMIMEISEALSHELE